MVLSSIITRASSVKSLRSASFALVVAFSLELLFFVYPWTHEALKASIFLELSHLPSFQTWNPWWSSKLCVSLTLPSPRSNHTFLTTWDGLFTKIDWWAIVASTFLSGSTFMLAWILIEATRSSHWGHWWILVQQCVKVKDLPPYIFLKRVGRRKNKIH